MTTALELQAVSKSFGDTRALIDVDLTVADGELLVIVGPSGCGKSTLLRIVAGLLSADRGHVTIGDVLVDDGVRRADPEHRGVGLVFQEHSLFPHLTVTENLTFGVRSLNRQQRHDHSAHWLRMIGLPDAGERYPHELSGGERQRVALARALAPQPRLMLLDEPFASLDPNLRSHLRADIVDILRASGTAAVFVTHDQSEALAIGDRVAVIRAGSIEAVGTPEAVFHRPRNRFVASFMGEASFLDYDPDTGTTELGPVSIAADELAQDADRLVVVRPAHVRMHLGDDAPAFAVEAKVTSAEFRGLDRHYHLLLPSGTAVESDQPHTVDLSPGDSVRLSLAPGDYAVVPQ